MEVMSCTRPRSIWRPLRRRCSPPADFRIALTIAWSAAAPAPWCARIRCSTRRRWLSSTGPRASTTARNSRVCGQPTAPRSTVWHPPRAAETGFWTSAAAAASCSVWHRSAAGRPSAELSPAATPYRRPTQRSGRAIVQDILREGLFEPESFDAVTLFQVLRPHPRAGRVPARVPRDSASRRRDPRAEPQRRGSGRPRLLGERSPIIDVEHTYLYSPETMRRIFTQAGFDVLNVERFGTPTRSHTSCTCCRYPAV